MNAGPDRVRRRRRGRALAAALAVTALVAGALLAGPPTDGQPLDPRSTAPDGLRGLVEVAGSMGAQVDISADLPSDTSVHLFIAQDGLDDDTRDEVTAWVRQGGVLVVSDPASPLHGLEPVGQPVSDLVGPRARTPDCGLPALASVGEVSHAGWVGFEAGDDDVACFAGTENPWLVARPTGEGTLIALGSPAPLLNRSLDRDDNAVLAAALLFPGADARLQILPPGEAPPADVAIEELLPDRLPAALAVAALAVLLALLAIGRRTGRPVEERLPPTVPSAELARSVGDLFQRAGRREGAAARLRGQARDDVGRVLGSRLGPEDLARQIHHRLGTDPDVARRALVDLPVADDDELVGVAEAVEQVRRDLTTTGSSLTPERSATATPRSPDT